jgi:hypothetical protein
MGMVSPCDQHHHEKGQYSEIAMANAHLENQTPGAFARSMQVSKWWDRFGAQRGLYLDASWRFMFASSGVGTNKR